MEDNLAKHTLKITNFDNENKLVSVTVDDVDIGMFPSDFNSSTNIQEFFRALEGVGWGALNPPQLSKVDATNWVGKEHTFESAYDGTDKTIIEILQENLEQYPVANKESIMNLCSIYFDNLLVEPMIRVRDTKWVGIYVSFVHGQPPTEGARGLRSIKKCNKLALSLGVPMFAGTNPRSGMTPLELRNYVDSLDERNKFLHIGTSYYVYQDWDLGLAQNKKMQDISLERKQNIENGIISIEDCEFTTNEENRLYLLNKWNTMQEGFYNKTYVNLLDKNHERVTLSLPEFKDLIEKLHELIENEYEKEHDRKSKVYETTTMEALESI